MISKPKKLEPEIDQNVILKFSLVISLVCNKHADIEALAPAPVFTIVLSCLDFNWCIIIISHLSQQMWDSVGKYEANVTRSGSLAHTSTLY